MKEPVRRYGQSVDTEQRRFLEALRATGKPGDACKAVNVSRQRVYQWRETYPLFAVAWDKAIDDYRERQLQEVMLRQSDLTIKEEMVWQELAAIAFTHVRQVIAWDGDTVRLTPSEQLPPYVSAAVQSVKVKSRVYVDVVEGNPTRVNETEIEVRMHDKLKALESLRKEFALYRQRAEFMDAFVALVQEHVRDAEGQDAILRFLETNARLPVLDEIAGGLGPDSPVLSGGGVSR